MTTKDISRFLFRPAQHYVGARMQQGRVLLDSDFNEEARLDDEDQRRALKDLIGPKGSPDDGFSLDLELGDQIIKDQVSFNGATAIDVLNYRIRPGAIYIAGLRFENEPVGFDNGDPIFEPIVFQRDFLQMGEDDAPKPLAGQTHRQLAYLRAFEQCVSAVEDDEIREKALGGLDTSVRVRRMRRVEVREVNGTDCDAAWQEVRGALETETGGTFDADGGELRSGARLQIEFEPGDALDPCAPCLPSDAGRYLGAENQAIRIMIAAPDKYVWAFDNASPLYRVTVGTPVSGMVPIKMLTPPKDEARRPLEHTVVEFLPWSALLDNGEKVASLVGVFARVTAGFDPDTGEFKIAESDLAQIEALVQEWDSDHPDKNRLPNTNDPNGQYLFLRVWHQLDAAGDPLLSTGTDPANHVLLRRIGLLPTFTGTGSPGDFWVVTVRPDTPQEIVPWDLTQENGVPPHGPRMFFAPLTLVTLRQPVAGEHTNSEVVDALHDCRATFRPLIRSRGCCIHTVGDGVRSRGDFRSVQAAINALPPAGGKVCVLPGTYQEQVTITGDNIVVEGCGPSSRIESPGGSSAPEALIQITGEHVTIRELGVSAIGQIGILVGEEDPMAAVSARDITLAELEIVSMQGTRPARSCIEVRNGEDVRILDSELTLDGTITDDSVAVVRGTRLLVEGNRLETRLNQTIFGAWGGLQIAGGSTDVEVRRNHITGGIGHGITLGSLIWTAQGGGTVRIFSTARGLVNTDSPCPFIDTTRITGVILDDIEFVPDTAGDLENVRIIDNRIENMSANGISVLTLFPFIDENLDFISTDNLLIERNRIVDNMQNVSRLAATSAVVAKKGAVLTGQESVFGQFVAPPLPAAAILLADGENIRIRHNEVRDNGKDDPEATCGICVVFGDNIVIDGNRVQNNGKNDPGASTGRFGAPGGIVVFLAGIASIPEEGPPVTEVGGTSLRVTGNIVEHPNGNALFAGATGPLVVDGNYLQSLGNNATAQAPGASHAVTIFNLGLPWETLDLPENEPDPLRWEKFPAQAPDYLHRGEEGFTLGAGGRVLFNNNHVTLKWTPPEGSTTGLQLGFSVVIASLDDVTMIGNQLALNVEDPVLKKKSTGGFIVGIPRILVHALVVGATANVSNNRVAEPVNDALISLLVLGGLLVSSTHNILTHMGFATTCLGDATDPDHLTDEGNLFLLVPKDAPLFQLFDEDALEALASGVFQIFCAFFLELEATTPM